MTLADVKLWGSRIGSVRQDEPGIAAVFEYDREFLRSAIEVSPIHLPLSPGLFRFPELSRAAFAGLPGLLSDSLPDRFGNQLIDNYLATQGKPSSSLDSVERLCYISSRGMGALEFEPSQPLTGAEDRAIDISKLRELAAAVIAKDSAWNARLDNQNGIEDILQVGTSAGGARPKAVIAWNPSTDEVRSGKIDDASGFEYWLLKFDGVDDGGGREVGDGLGYGLIEYAYAQLAMNAGIEMTECRLFDEGGRRHFMTKRFDRTNDGDKLHMHTFGGMSHFDFNENGAHSYEEVFQTMRKLDLTPQEVEQQFLRMAFNIVARNQDDHVKNISFLMDRRGQWRLSPAYDVTYAYNADGRYTSTHQMSMNGKVDGFAFGDFEACGNAAILKRGRWRELLEQVMGAVSEWPEIASKCGVDEQRIAQISRVQRLAFLEIQS